MDEQQRQSESENRKRSFIKIPTYDEVFNSSDSNPPANLFRPSSSFSEALSGVKANEAHPEPNPSRPGSSLSAVEVSSSAIGATSTSSSTSAAASASTSAQSPYPSPQSRTSILVNHRQKGNPLLKHIRNVKWMFADVVCDFLLGQSSCALYLSLRYHLLHPDYLYYRIRELQKNFKLRVVLCHVDVEDVVKPLLEVTKTALLHDCSLLCGWSLEECGRYLETIKVYENKSADIIRERMDTDYMSRLNHALTTVRHVNKSDVVTLGSAFGSLANIMDASMDDLARCPGIGDRKVKRLYDTFHEPFKRVVASRPTTISETLQRGDENVAVEAGKEEEIAIMKPEKEPTASVKSALAAAYAKYSEKLHKQDEGNAEFKEGKDNHGKTD
ncbi:hypothetical protein H6P81_005525 [Aristolochia fimbriata]|uniref:DNA excision repair protein ERCC-1 n=1 Tax=Aristolochia fimbriata TaxID=158543 RepID=A0AAV7EXI5_ARIFI|nr:hypothetical protein H6P81_005525 [Aristolochia fimbriata]